MVRVTVSGMNHAYTGPHFDDLASKTSSNPEPLPFSLDPRPSTLDQSRCPSSFSPVVPYQFKVQCSRFKVRSSPFPPRPPAPSPSSFRISTVCFPNFCFKRPPPRPS